jgi:NTE family protein
VSETPPVTGLVLSGGGARGAYEVGVLQAIVEIIGPGQCQSAFQVYTGTSVGALNATWLAAHADQPDMGIHGLAEKWSELRIDEHLRLNRLRDLIPRKSSGTWSLLNIGPLAKLMTSTMPWARLHQNIQSGAVHALAVACLEVATGQTVIFAETAPNVTFRPTRSPSRQGRTTQINAEHILASTSLPFLFPPRKIDGSWFVDGGLRFNTPIAPALRLGAERVCVISLLSETDATTPKVAPIEFPSPSFLAGKILDALLLDPMVHDIQVLDRFNALMDVLDDVLTEEEQARVDDVITERRGMPYRRIDRLLFRPTADIGEMAAQFVKKIRVRRPATAILTQAMKFGESKESDLLSFLMFDKTFVEPLIDLGYQDAKNRRDEIEAFFGPSQQRNGVLP